MSKLPFNLTQPSQKPSRNDSNPESSKRKNTSKSQESQSAKRRTLQYDELIQIQAAAAKDRMNAEANKFRATHMGETRTEQLQNFDSSVFMNQYTVDPFMRHQVNDNLSLLLSERNQLAERNTILQNRLDTVMREFKELHSIRYTEAEESAFLLKEEAIKQQEAVLKLERAAEKFLSRGAMNDMEIVQENSDLKEKLRSMIDLKDFNRDVFGLKIKSVCKVDSNPAENIDAGSKYTCEMESRAGVYTYTLLIPDDRSKRVIYVPGKNNSNLVTKDFPDFLLEEIDFTMEELPIFSYRLIQSLNTRN